MTVFCNECGTSVSEGSKFCLNCGSSLPESTQQAVPPVQEPPPQAVQQPPPNQEQKKGGGFWTSGAGIALVAILGVAVIAGITLGIIFLVKGSGDDEGVDAATVKVWDKYESLLEENSESFPQITTDANYLANTQAEIKKTQDKVKALEEALEETAGSGRRRQGTSGTTTRDVKADELAEALAAYSSYVKKMNELFAALVGANLLDQNTVDKLNNILADLKELGDKVKTLSNAFLKNNDKVVAVKIDAPVLDFASTAAQELQKNVTAAQEAEKARLAAEKAAADAAAAAEAERQRQAAEAEKKQQANVSRCPVCGASDPSVWMEMRGSYKCYNCGYRQEKQ